MTEEKLREIEARWDKITPAPWIAERAGEWISSWRVVAPCPCCGLIGEGLFESDAEAIAHAPEDIEDLIAEIRALNEEIRDGIACPPGCPLARYVKLWYNEGRQVDTFGKLMQQKGIKVSHSHSSDT